MDNAHHLEMSKTIASLRPIVLLEEQQEVGGCLWDRTGHVGCGQKGEGLAVGVQVQPWVAPQGWGHPEEQTRPARLGRGDGHSRQRKRSAKPKGNQGDDQASRRDRAPTAEATRQRVGRGLGTTLLLRAKRKLK